MNINPYIFYYFNPSYPILLINSISKYIYVNKNVLIITNNVININTENISTLSFNDNLDNYSYDVIFFVSHHLNVTIAYIHSNFKIIQNKKVIILYYLNDTSLHYRDISTFLHTINKNFNIIIHKNNKFDHILFICTPIHKSKNNHNNIKNIINKIKKLSKKSYKIDYTLLLQYIITIGKKYNFSINNYYQDYIDKYTLRLKRDIYSQVNSIIILCNGSLELNNNNFNIHSGNTLDNFTYIYNKMIQTKTLRNNLVLQYNINDKNDILFHKTKINREHLSKYLHNNYVNKYIKKPLNNAFIKLYEILHDIELLKIQDKYVTIHLAELPGGFIYATNTMINKISKNANHIWYGNSYNPKVKTNVFDDGYKLVEKYPDRWLWGQDKTGDITNIDNLHHIKKNIKEKHIDLITLDGGLNISNNLHMLQKLDYAQMLTVAMLSTKGTNCVVKTFGNYLDQHPESMYSIELYIDIMCIYCSMFEFIYLVKPPNSSYNSMEYYIVGKNFISLDLTILHSLQNYMSQFEVNKSFLFKKNNFKINEIITNLYKFYDSILQLNIEELNKQIFMISCQQIDINSDFYDKEFINKSYSFIENNKLLYNIGINKAKLWCNMYHIDSNILITL